MNFKNSRRLTWFTLLVATGLCVLIVFKPSSEASQVLMLSIPAMLGLVGGWTHVVNRAEKK